MTMIRLCAFLILLASCSSHQENACKYGGVDYIFLAHYQNCLSIVSLYQKGSKAINSSQFLQALKCLNAITSIEPHVYLGDVVGYTSEENVNMDLKNWGEWYARNMDDFSFDDAYEKFEEYRKANQEEVTWPPMLIDIMVKPN